jgi:HTH-type transcriptional regulator/antitoxin HipB
MYALVDLTAMYEYVDTMLVRTSRELGAAIRKARSDRSWSQVDLAERAGVTRAWVITAEQGKASVELGLVLRALAALGLTMDLVAEPADAAVRATASEPVAPRGGPRAALVDLDEIIAAARGGQAPAGTAGGEVPRG